MKQLSTHTHISVHLLLCIKTFALAGHRSMSFSLHLQAWRHRASTRSLASFLPTAEVTRTPKERLLGPLLNAGTPIFRSHHPSAPLPPELPARAQRLRLCSAPGILHLDPASLLSKVLLSESSSYTAHRPRTWATLDRHPSLNPGPLGRG